MRLPTISGRSPRSTVAMNLERRYGKNMLIGIAILAVYGLAQGVEWFVGMVRSGPGPF